MDQNSPYIGIDFGTTNSSMAWFNPKTQQPEVLYNSQREGKTPSLVYYGRNETLVGKPAENFLKDCVGLDDAARHEEIQRVCQSVKRKLLSPPRIPLPDGRDVRPVEVAAEIVRKLKSDAKELHFKEEVKRLVITYPAVFDGGQRRAIKEVARLAGFSENDIKMIEEPVAAALAFASTGHKVGDGVLVYDLGGGTFDLAFLVRDGDSFRVALETDGDPHCGGDDFDQLLYDFWDGQVREQRGRPISLSERTVDLFFLHDCRKRKENLSERDYCKFSSWIPGMSRPMEVAIKRSTFEDLIRERVEKTVRKTVGMVERARREGYQVDTLVLIGGSSEIPLVRERLKETLNLEPYRWQHRDWAVALGAAYYAQQAWKEKDSNPFVQVPDGAQQAESSDMQKQYRQAQGQRELIYPAMDGDETVTPPLTNAGNLKNNIGQTKATLPAQPITQPITQPTTQPIAQPSARQVKAGATPANPQSIDEKGEAAKIAARKAASAGAEAARVFAELAAIKTRKAANATGIVARDVARQTGIVARDMKERATVATNAAANSALAADVKKAAARYEGQIKKSCLTTTLGLFFILIGLVGLSVASWSSIGIVCGLLMIYLPTGGRL
jgi:actin-like ATPase involved in cell morphogenesis